MPIIKSSKKRSRQNQVIRVRNHSQLSRMRSFVKNITKWTQDDDVQKAEAIFDETQKSIDICSKKNLIHKNNAARKKSHMMGLITSAKIRLSKAPEGVLDQKKISEVKNGIPKKTEKSEKKGVSTF